MRTSCLARQQLVVRHWMLDELIELISRLAGDSAAAKNYKLSTPMVFEFVGDCHGGKEFGCRCCEIKRKYEAAMQMYNDSSSSTMCWWFLWLGEALSPHWWGLKDIGLHDMRLHTLIRVIFMPCSHASLTNDCSKVSESVLCRKKRLLEISS